MLRSQAGIRTGQILVTLCAVIVILLLITSCSTSALTGPGSGEEPPPEGSLATQEQGLEEEPAASNEEDPEGEDIPPVSLAEGLCPKEGNSIEAFFLVVHSWDFSPNRDLSMMKVDGQTDPMSSCRITISGSKVSGEPCLVPITTSGYLQTDDGKCDLQATGYARIEFEDGSCEDGVVTVTIFETLDPDAGYDGAMNCPEISQPYAPVYPISRSTHSFMIKAQGDVASKTANPDETGQFRYEKKWNLMVDMLLD